MTFRPSSHGSHPHPLVLHQRGGPCRYLNCSICQAVVDLQQDSTARRCSQCSDFLLCAKCFDVDEHPFATPQIVVRNPMLSRNDASVAIRTRPRSSAYVLCPIHAGELIEVVAYAESKEDVGTVYFRQRVGGWVNSTHVVCVVPSERSIAVLAKLHIQYESQGHAAALPVHDAIECMEESITLLNENSSFGAVLSCLTFLPLQLYLTANSSTTSTDSISASECSPQQLEMEEFVFRLVEFANFVLIYAAEELQTVIAKGPVVLSSDAGIILLVRLIGRALCCLWHIPSPHIAQIPASVYPAVCNAAKTLTLLLAELRVSQGDPSTAGTAPKGTFPSSIFAPSDAHKTLELWRAVQADNAAMDLKALRARELIISLLEVVGHLMQDVPSFFLSFRPDDLSPLRNAVTLLSSTSCLVADDIATLLCEISAAHLLRASQNADIRVLNEMQSAVLDIDLIEVALKLIKGGRDEAKVIAGLGCLSRICLRNPHIISITAAIVIPHVIHCLRTTQYDTVANAAFDACTSLAFNSPQRPPAHRRSANRDGEVPSEATTLPFCSATLHKGSSPFQEMFLVFSDSGSCTALCAHCAQTHPPAQSGLARHNTLPFGYFVCQCGHCAAASSGPSAPPPNIPLTSAQKMLASNRILSVMTQRLRAHGWRVANSVGRLSMLICCSEEVAQALFCSLVEQHSLRNFADASLAVAACQYFSHVSCLIQTYSDSAISKYIRGARDIEPSVDSISSSLAHVERTPTMKSVSHADPMGLTPSPTGGEGPPPRRYSGGGGSLFSSSSNELIAHR